MSRGYNWRNTLTHYASVCGTIAGFCVAFIGIILGWSLADVKIYADISFGYIAVFFFGISTVLFVSASEFFLHSKNYDVFELSEEYRDWLARGFPDKDWDRIWEEQTIKCRVNEKYGRYCYNFGLFMLFFGLLFVIYPYNVLIAFIISSLGIVLQLLQFWKNHGLRT